MKSLHQSFEMVEHLVFTDSDGGEKYTSIVSHRHLGWSISKHHYHVLGVKQFNTCKLVFFA